MYKFPRKILANIMFDDKYYLHNYTLHYRIRLRLTHNKYSLTFVNSTSMVNIKYLFTTKYYIEYVLYITLRFMIVF